MTTEMKHRKTKTEVLIRDINSYDQKLKSLPKNAIANDDCNKYLSSDVLLCDTARRIETYARQNKIYSFGLKLEADKDYGVGDNSKMRKRCCNCPSNPVPSSQKLIFRAKYQRYVRTWRQKAKEWISKGCKEEDFTTSTIVRNRTTTQVGVKRLS